jgi:Phosphotransferase enzyme family
MRWQETGPSFWSGIERTSRTSFFARRRRIATTEALFIQIAAGRVGSTLTDAFLALPWQSRVVPVRTFPHRFRSAEEALFATKHLPNLAERGLAPPTVEWGPDYVTTVGGTWLPDWLDSVDSAQVEIMRPHVLALVRGIHEYGVCHRDLHVENVVVIDNRPLAIDFEHASEVDPSWPCYDISGPSMHVAVPPAHVAHGGTLGTSGIWWNGPLDARWGARYRPLGLVFGAI